ncbi:MAG: class I SAM-dependent methyltransferase [Chloroflexota bacterium]|nr:class I SAM-dependent methyltransferase [Chloroflexota bacterium]
MHNNGLEERLALALKARSKILMDEQTTAVRLFAGFCEGCPELVVDLYGSTLVLFDYAKSLTEGKVNLGIAQDFYLDKLPWIVCVVQKKRSARDQQSRRGVLTFGESPAQQISEDGVIYAVDLLMNQDASFYIDTRNLRGWLLENSTGWQTLNTFAYTGSLGIAALAGGSARVIQTDRGKKFLALARQSAIYNKFGLEKMKLRRSDFFSEVARLKRSSALFDCVIIDPPIFSSTTKGKIDLINDSTRLINKVRPLVKDGGWLVSINNALFLSGAEYLASLEKLCQDGYLSIESLIPIPEDIAGFPKTIINHPPTDPAPFNHSTKIALLKVKRKA